ncbi:MAG: hypothetical protein ACPGYX_08755 [Oceanobacter sp.]
MILFETSLLLGLGFALLGTLLLIALLRARLGFAISLALIALTLSFFWLNFSELQSLKGWPSERQPPEEFQLISTLIHEPDNQAGDAGAIYLWGIPKDGDGRPRAYQLPYSPPMHESTAEAETMISDGKRVIARRDEPDANQAESSGDSMGSRYIFEPVTKQQLPPKK